MRLPNANFVIVTKDSFVEFWSSQYDDPNEHLYDDNIEKEKTVETIENLYIWKNGLKLSETKLGRVQREYKPDDDVLTRLKTDRKLWRYISRDNAAIWNIFWLHCLSPLKFPIYDKNAHRAMAFSFGLGVDDLEIPKHETEIGISYVKYFIPFFQELSQGCTTVRQIRKIDQALFWFGKFIGNIGNTNLRIWLNESDLP